MAARRYTAEERRELAEKRGIIVDPEDMWLIEAYTWGVNAGCVRTDIPGPSPRKHALLHHCIVGQPIHAGIEIDHIDRNPKNNRRSNLRYITHGLNHLNSDWSDRAYHITRTSWSGLYQVNIKRDGVRHYLGVYETVEAAEEARDQWLSAHGI